ncbi:MAG: VPLPA-CTERM sorting domain-containing protein [Jannaschia sp.]
MFGTNKAAAIAALFCISAGGASAATASFNFGCDGAGVSCDSSSSSYWNVSSLPAAFSLTDGDLTVEARARYFYGGVSYVGNTVASADPREAHIGRFQGGAGVFNGAGDNHTVDGNDYYNDFIQLSFDKAVTLDSIGFGYISTRADRRGPDDFRLMYDLDGDGTIGVGDYFSDELRTSSNFTALPNVSSKVWGFAAFGKDDDWKLKSVAVSYVEPVAPVPLPAAVWLMLAGLAGLFGVSRRKTA